MITPFKIRLIPFFHSFEDDQLKAIISYFEHKTLNDGEPILQQNRINNKLFFLISGSVSIYINNKHILDIDRPGEVFGEMSIANYSTCTATVMTKGTAEFFVFSFEEMRKNVDPNFKDVVLKNIYKGTMEILALKLMNSNKSIN